ncbi:MAG: hypothetical protein RR540_01300 [Oscillospiraceae bacterium]
MDKFMNFYEQTFGEYESGDPIKFIRDGVIYDGILLFKSRYLITVQLDHYREGFNVPDFFVGHSKIIKSDEEIELLKAAEKIDEDDEIDAEISADFE